MAFEGEPRVIPIKGIARAGADNLCEDGAMNEVIGLEYKDGSYVPYTGNALTKGVPNWAKGIYIHKTSTDTNVIVRTDSGLLWMTEESFNTTEDIGDEGEWNTLYEGEVKDVEFIKNVICISTPEKLLYMLFQEGEYKDWTLDKEELPRINFRVDIGIGGKKDALGIKRSVYYGEYPEGGIKDVLIAPLIAAKGRAREEGGLTGHFLVCAAYRLKTGEYVKASNPVLMCRPMHKEKDMFYDEKTDSNEFTLFRLDSLKAVQKTFTPSINEIGVHFSIASEADSSTPEDFSYLKKNEVNDEGTNMYNNSLYIVDENKDVYRQENASDFDMFYPPMGSSMRNQYYESTKNMEVKVAAAVPTNKLQYKINSDITVDESLISGLCIFISKEIDPFLSLEKNDNLEEPYKASTVIIDNYTYIRSLHAIFKTDDEIVNEIKNINNLYLVHEIDYADIKKSDGWIDVDLKGKLGDALATRETLPISAFDNTIIKDAEMDAYNSRLHIYNYKEEERCGYNIEDYNLYGGYGQYSASQEEEFDSACIVVDYKSVNGSSRTVKHFDKPVLTTNGVNALLNPCIAYHRGNATSITFYLKKLSDTTNLPQITNYSVRKYELTKSKNGGYALHLTKELTPSLTTSELNATVLPEQFNESTERESMRVSDTFLPQTFQYANTYTIGNGTIIGVATLTTALSQDTFGQYPLLVFCTDGVYSMNVDTTGNGVYTNVPPPFSREVCINRNTICEIDGAVLFASNKGLMIATSQGVQEFVPNLNGEPKHKPDTKEIHGLGLELYGRAITNSQVTTLLNYVDISDFREYVADPNTVVTYASEKNKILIYNGKKPYVYWIDIPTRNVTKLPVSIRMDNNDYPTELYVQSDNHMMEFKQLSANVNTQTMFQTRPIKLDGGMKTAMRVIVRGYFNSNEADKWAVLLVLGSYDGINWQPLGLKQKPLEGGFNDLGCVVDRVSHKYMMVIFSASLNRDSHIDGIELTKTNKYNNKLK